MSTGELLFVGTASGLIVLGDEGAGQLRELRRALVGLPLDALAVAPRSVAALVAGGATMRSADAGWTWEIVPGLAVEAIGLRVATAAGPAPLANPRLMGATAYARLGGRQPVLMGAGAGGALLFRSLDEGIHWEPAGGASRGRITTIVPSARAGCAWAGTDGGQLLRSADRGASWAAAAQLDAPIRCLAAASWAVGRASQAAGPGEG